MDSMPSAHPAAAGRITTTARGGARPLRDLASMLTVGVLAIPYAAVLGGVFLLGRWDALRRRRG